MQSNNRIALTLGALALALTVVVQTASAELSLQDYVLNVFHVDCGRTFDEEYWRAFDRLMMEEWGIRSVSICVNWDQYYQLYALSLISENVVIVDDDFDLKYTDANGELHGAQGLAYTMSNRGYVEWHGETDTSDTLSHEILHLILEERGYPRRVYNDLVHENAGNLRFELVELRYVAVVAKFEVPLL